MGEHSIATGCQEFKGPLRALRFVHHSNICELGFRAEQCDSYALVSLQRARGAQRGSEVVVRRQSSALVQGDPREQQTPSARSPILAFPQNSSATASVFPEQGRPEAASKALRSLVVLASPGSPSAIPWGLSGCYPLEHLKLHWARPPSRAEACRPDSLPLQRGLISQSVASEARTMLPN